MSYVGDDLVSGDQRLAHVEARGVDRGAGELATSENFN